MRIFAPFIALMLLCAPAAHAQIAVCPSSMSADACACWKDPDSPKCKCVLNPHHPDCRKGEDVPVDCGQFPNDVACLDPGTEPVSPFNPHHTTPEWQPERDWDETIGEDSVPFKSGQLPTLNEGMPATGVGGNPSGPPTGIACAEDEYYDESISSCRPMLVCSEGMRFDYKKYACVHTAGECLSTETFNENTGECEYSLKCPVGSSFDKTTNKCTTDEPPACAGGQYYNPVTGTCMNAEPFT